MMFIFFLFFLVFDLKMHEREKGEVFLIVIGDCQNLWRVNSESVLFIVKFLWDSEMTELPLDLRLGEKDCKEQ